MFDSLVESGSHAPDVARKGSFFLGTFAIYAVVLLALVVGSILWVDTQLAAQNDELLTELALPMEQAPEPEIPQPERQEQPRPTTEQQVATRTELIAPTNVDTNETPPPSTTRSTVPPAPPGAIRGARNEDPIRSGGPVGIPGGTSVGTVAPTPQPGAPPPPPPPAPTPRPQTVVSGGVLTGRAVSRPDPVYPPAARAVRASGPVTVQILVDERGSVISATAVSGHPLLRPAAVAAIRRWRFTPTQLSGQPVRTNGTVTVNFTLQ